MIEVSKLSKHFSEHLAVNNLSFTVQPGEVIGFLGPNGAGKSTTMKMLTGFLAPSAGSVKIHGFDIAKQRIRAQRVLGYLPEGAPCYGEMTVLDFLLFIGKVRGYRGKELQERVKRVIDLLELGRVIGQSIDTLSKGFNRRVGLAQAVMHEPKVLILDEPTDGLDPNQKHQVRQLIKALAKDRIVIISTHILEEVSALCTRVLLIAHGELIVDETPHQLLQRSKYHQAVTLYSENALDQAALKALLGVQSLEENSRDGSLTLIPEPGAVLFPVVNALIQQRGWQVQEIAVESGRLDEVFRRLTRGESA